VAATQLYLHVTLGGSLIPIVVIGMGMALFGLFKSCGPSTSLRTGFVAATQLYLHVTLGGSLIPIVVIGMGMALPQLN